MTKTLPLYQHAIQLIAPDELILNNNKPISKPGPYQILCSIEAVGLCFSDLKLLKQFSDHPRKKTIISGIDQSILDSIPSYVPNDMPTVPGHETVVRIEAIGKNVEGFEIGERYLVQTDYRWLPTDGSNASFGYDFEGGLQEYVLMDTRIITSPEGESMLIPASSDVSASAIALVEPWACVENSYASKERKNIKADGKTLIVCDVDINQSALKNFFNEYGKPKHLYAVSINKMETISDIDYLNSIDSVIDNSIDDILYFGSNAKTVESLFPKLAAHGLLNLIQCGNRFNTPVLTAIGRVHYGGIRIIGTTGCDPSASMRYIPSTGEIRSGDIINVVGAGGPMGMMHVIRDICQNIPDVSVYASDLNAERLEALSKIAVPIAYQRDIQFKAYNPKEESGPETVDYTAIMVPVPVLVSQAIKSANVKGIINIFAGIPAQVSAEFDIDTYISKQLYFIGTSGSVLDDMKTVLSKVSDTKRLDTNLSVAAISGLDGAIEGIRAVEHQLLAGKIIVYPACKGMGLISLDKLSEIMPDVAEKMPDGTWNSEAEKELLNHYIN